MSQIGSLVASAAVLFNLDFVPENILVGAVNTDVPLSNLNITAAGEQLWSVTAAARIQAVAKYDQGGLLGADVKTPMWLRVAVGRINKSCTINMTNSGATTPAVYAASSGLTSVARTGVEQSINASANQTFEGFEALFFDPSNVARVLLTFADGFSDEFAPAELDALFASRAVTDADGRLSGQTVIKADMPDDNDIVRATIYNTAGGATVVLKTGFKEL